MSTISQQHVPAQYCTADKSSFFSCTNSNAIQTLPLSLANCTSLERLHLGGYLVLFVDMGANRVTMSLSYAIPSSERP
jgi:hypothetical protein